MPKLTIPERTYGKTIGCLIDLYKKEPGFIEELQKIRSVYEPAVIKWLDSSVPQWRRLQAELMRARDRQDDSTKLTDASIKLSERLSYGIKRFYEGRKVTSDLINYEKELRELAYRWCFNIKQPGVALSALKWALRNPNVVPIPSMTDMDQLEQNFSAMAASWAAAKSFSPCLKGTTSSLSP